MESSEKKAVLAEIAQVLRTLQPGEEGWIEFAKLGKPLAEAGVRYQDFGFAKLRPFLNEFPDELELREEQEEGKPPVCYVRPCGAASLPGPAAPAAAGAAAPGLAVGPREPSKELWLFKWAAIPNAKIRALAGLALEERWDYGSEKGKETYPILRNYLGYTFKRLCAEGKVALATDPVRGEEYAAFNTGLVDKKYTCIYALFKQNTLYDGPYWYLIDFAVPGEDAGKTIVSLFNPLPQRADYFENKIENMLYDTSSGYLSCDYTHILVERTSRLPADFLEDNCPDSFLTIDGVRLGDITGATPRPVREQYFAALGEKIRGNARILNRLKNRLEDAVNLALKRVEWNYKTAIPTYNPKRNKGSLLLPLSLLEEDRVDLALVVDRQLSGAYQGQTILPLALAYSNSRLVSRPDSDWLKTDLIAASETVDADDED